MEQKLEQVAASEQTSKSEIIKEALQQYFASIEQKEYPYQLGEDMFGKYGSGSGSLSRDYKKLVRGKIHAKKSD